MSARDLMVPSKSSSKSLGMENRPNPIEFSFFNSLFAQSNEGETNAPTPSKAVVF